MKSLLIAIGTNKALICYRALILFYSVPFWQFSSKLGNLDWNNGINSSAVMLYKLPGITFTYVTGGECEYWNGKETAAYNPNNLTKSDSIVIWEVTIQRC